MRTPAPSLSNPRLPLVRLGLAVGLLLGSLACASKDEKVSSPPAVAPAPVANAPVETAPAIPDAAPASASQLAYSLSAHTQSQTATAPGPATAMAVSTGGDVRVSIQNFSYYCQPDPAFSSKQEGGLLTIVLNPPTGAISRCVASHNMTLTFAGIDVGASVETIEVRGVDGEVIVTAGVTRTR